MSSLTRFGISLDATLLVKFDTLCEARGYNNRSEAIRDLIRQTLVEAEWEQNDAVSAGTLTLVYDHHKSDLAQRMTGIQHEEHHLILTSLHIHLDEHNCLEIIVFKGKSSEIRAFAERLIATKGVVYGNFSLAPTTSSIG